jgi:tRNA U34 5-methylaminomethyl-2-thiouridine-forming methyltransferase MnmC
VEIKREDSPHTSSCKLSSKANRFIETSFGLTKNFLKVLRQFKKWLIEKTIVLTRVSFEVL